MTTTETRSRRTAICTMCDGRFQILPVVHSFVYAKGCNSNGYTCRECCIKFNLSNCCGQQH